MILFLNNDVYHDVILSIHTDKPMNLSNGERRDLALPPPHTKHSDDDDDDLRSDINDDKLTSDDNDLGKR